jgi:hypothetical protein
MARRRVVGGGTGGDCCGRKVGGGRTSEWTLEACARLVSRHVVENKTNKPPFRKSIVHILRSEVHLDVIEPSCGNIF